MKTIFSLLAVLALSLTTGCDPRSSSSSSSGGVALVDLEAVAKRLGRDTEIETELKSAGEQLQTQLASAQKELQEEFTRLKEVVGETPSTEENQKLADLGRDLNGKFQQKQQSARQEISNKRSELVMRFREEIRPVALRVASARGLNIVLVKSDIVVLANALDADITGDVIAELQGNPASAPSTAADTAKPPAAAESPDTM